MDLPEEEAQADNGAAEEDIDDFLEELLRRQEQEAESRPSMSQHHPNRMMITEEDREYALEIKSALQASPEVDCPNDFWCAQHAIIESNLSCAVDRALQLQHFREEYGIVDTYEFGSKCLKDLLELFPGIYMSFDFSESDGSYIIVSDLQKFDISALKNPRNDLVWIRATYFTYQIMCCDMESIRRGVHIIHECDGYDWKKNMSLNKWRQLYTELTANYPLKIGKLKNFHTGTFFNLLVSMFKRFMPLEFQSQFKVGLVAEARLDTLYNVPSLEAAQKRVLGSMQEALKKRYGYETSFSLNATGR
jgi:CRAL/TRIO domain